MKNEDKVTLVELRDEGMSHMDAKSPLPSPKVGIPGRVGRVGWRWWSQACPRNGSSTSLWQWVGEMGFGSHQALTNMGYQHRSNTYLLSLHSRNICFILAQNFYTAWC